MNKTLRICKTLVMTTGVLLVNLGTPDAPTVPAVKRYLKEFLTDKRVIDLPYVSRHLLVRGLIVPRRAKESTKAYAHIWTDEGSPLLVHSKKIQVLLQKELGGEFVVALGMRYQNPSLHSALEQLKGLSKIVIIPLFPQYASATTGSVHEKVFDLLSSWQTIPELRFVNSYPTDPLMIAAFAQRAQTFDLNSYDKIVMSFHGLPEQYLKNAHPLCLSTGCCQHRLGCYRAQCFQTAHALAKALKLNQEQYCVAFQSRLGKSPWIQPYTSDVLKKFKNSIVFCPSFIADCLETLYEIKIEYGQTLVPSLNDHPLWIQALAQMARHVDQSRELSR
ncbi:MAG: ferrochelatase [Verrucomicrobia bacterium]|nr:ferrochelatase [Verrucomicrobiota bacterium]